MPVHYSTPPQAAAIGRRPPCTKVRAECPETRPNSVLVDMGTLPDESITSWRRDVPAVLGLPHSLRRLHDRRQCHDLVGRGRISGLWPRRWRVLHEGHRFAARDRAGQQCRFPGLRLGAAPCSGVAASRRPAAHQLRVPLAGRAAAAEARRMYDTGSTAMVIGWIFAEQPNVEALRRAPLRLTQLAFQTAHLVLRIRDYDAYVEHRQRFPQDEPVMSHAEFYRECQKATYAIERGGFAASDWRTALAQTESSPLSRQLRHDTSSPVRKRIRNSSPMSENGRFACRVRIPI